MPTPQSSQPRTHEKVVLRSLEPGQATACEKILRSLPAWFGIESSLVQYVLDTQKYPTWLATDRDDPNTAEAVGFITLRQHFPESAEIHCMAVAPTHHRCGVGRAMIEFVEKHARAAGCRYLQVKTLGPSRVYEPYEQTRAFYRSVGFAPIEEFLTLWEGIPCLLLVKAL